jgi:hypothetical protein
MMKKNFIMAWIMGIPYTTQQVCNTSQKKYQLHQTATGNE